jgi:hypothetical protein
MTSRIRSRSDDHSNTTFGSPVLSCVSIRHASGWSPSEGVFKNVEPIHNFQSNLILNKKNCKAASLPPYRRQREEVQLLVILDLSTICGWVASVTPRPRFTPGEGPPPRTNQTGGWVGLRAGLDTKARRKILCLCQRSNPGRPVCSYWANQLQILNWKK